MSEPAIPLTYQTAPPATSASSKAFLGHAKLIGFFTLISRFLGLAREMVAGHYLGTGLVASAPIILNLCHIIVLSIGARIIHLSTKTPAADVVAKQTELAYWLALFVLVAGVLQVGILLPALRETGFRFRLVPHFWTPMVKRMLKLTVPVALGARVLQLSVLLDKGIALALLQRVD